MIKNFVIVESYINHCWLRVLNLGEISETLSLHPAGERWRPVPHWPMPRAKHLRRAIVRAYQHRVVKAVSAWHSRLSGRARSSMAVMWFFPGWTSSSASKPLAFQVSR